MTPQPVVVVGDVMVDVHLHVAPAADEKAAVTHRSRELGGTGANAAAVLASLGHRPVLHAAHGDDLEGEWIARRLEDGVGYDVRLATLPGRSGQATIVHRADGREVLVDQGVVLSVPTPTRGDIGDALVYVSYAPQAVIDLVQAGCGGAVIAGVEEWMLDVGGFAQALAGVRIVLTNHAGAQRLLSEGLLVTVPWVITRGADGVDIAWPDGSTEHVPATRVDAVDATGAGDCFAGVLIAMLAEGVPLPQAAGLAARGAALSTLAVGAQGRLPTREDLGRSPLGDAASDR